jgi:hypothetical protein
MSDFMKEATSWATMPVPGGRTPDEQRKAFDAMPVSEIAVLWRALQRVGLRDKTEGTWATFQYFDSLPHEQPDRALDMLLEVLKTEPEMPVLLQLGDKFVPAMLFRNGAAVMDRLERESAGNAQLRWLLGCASYWTEDEALKARLSTIADVEGWRASEEAHDKRNPPIDFGRLSPQELAKAWIEQSSLPDKDRDQNWMLLQDYERDLRDDDPERALAMILEVLKIETNPNMLSYLAAGPLEDLISLDTIDMIEEEAGQNPQFKELLGGVWYYSAPEELKARLDAIIEGKHW